METSAAANNEHARTMDRVYGVQRHFYDLTRKFFLFGRDTMIRQMDVRPGDRVLEVGCGTARNLIKLARLRDCELFGIDASSQMLKTATTKVWKAGLAGRIQLKHDLAENLCPDTFAIDRPFDAIFFSYALSMMTSWGPSVDAALACVKPGGVVYVVDFWDNRDLPLWFQSLCRMWLALGHVEYRPELIDHLQFLTRDGRATVEIDALTGRYAFIARLTRVPPGVETA